MSENETANAWLLRVATTAARECAATHAALLANGPGGGWPLWECLSATARGGTYDPGTGVYTVRSHRRAYPFRVYVEACARQGVTVPMGALAAGVPVRGTRGTWSAERKAKRDAARQARAEAAESERRDVVHAAGALPKHTLPLFR